MSRPVGSKNRSEDVLNLELKKLVSYVKRARVHGRRFVDMKRFVAALPTCTIPLKCNPLAVHMPFFAGNNITKCADGHYRYK